MNDEDGAPTPLSALRFARLPKRRDDAAGEIALALAMRAARLAPGVYPGAVARILFKLGGVSPLEVAEIHLAQTGARHKLRVREEDARRLVGAGHAARDNTEHVTIAREIAQSALARARQGLVGARPAVAMVFRARRGTMAHEDDLQRRARALRTSRRIGKVSFDDLGNPARHAHDDVGARSERASQAPRALAPLGVFRTHGDDPRTDQGQNHCVEAHQPLERPVSVERAYEFLSTVRDTAGKSRGHAALRKLRRVDEIVRREPELFAHEGPLPRMRATYHENHRSMPPATSMASIASSAHCRNHPAKSPVTPPKRDRATWRYHASTKSPATAIRAPTA